MANPADAVDDIALIKQARGDEVKKLFAVFFQESVGSPEESGQSFSRFLNGMRLLNAARDKAVTAIAGIAQ